MVGTCSKQDMRNARKFQAEILMEQITGETTAQKGMLELIQ